GTRRLVGQRNITLHHLLFVGVIELLVLRQIGLHDPQPHAVDIGGGSAGEPRGTLDRECRQRRRGGGRKQPGTRRVGALVRQHGGGPRPRQPRGSEDPLARR